MGPRRYNRLIVFGSGTGLAWLVTVGFRLRGRGRTLGTFAWYWFDLFWSF